MLDTSIHVTTQQFDGPLSLLLLLIQKEEMDIKQLDLTKITKQYLSFIEEMNELDFNLAGEYLYLAATLLLIKSKNCVTFQEEVVALGEDGGSLKITSESELIYRLEQLQHYKKMGEKLWGLQKLGHEVFLKPRVNRKVIINSILSPMELEKLTSVMMDFLFRQKRKYTSIKRDRLSIKEKLVFLKSYLAKGDKRKFTELLDRDGERTVENTVITFISLLELARLQRVNVFQNENKSTIYIEVVKSLEDFDVHQSNGFDDEEEEETQELNEAAPDTFSVPPIPMMEEQTVLN